MPQIIEFKKVFQITVMCFCIKLTIIKVLLCFNEKASSFFEIPAKRRIYTFFENYKCNTTTTLFYTYLTQKILPLVV